VLSKLSAPECEEAGSLRRHHLTIGLKRSPVYLAVLESKGSIHHTVSICDHTLLAMFLMHGATSTLMLSTGGTSQLWVRSE
jgi:hypothetical protein